MRLTNPLLSASALALVAALAGCAGPSGSPSAATATPDSTVDAPAAAAGGGAGGEICSIVPTAELAAATGAEPGTGSFVDEGNGLTDCTWTSADGLTVTARYTGDAGVFLPEDVWPKPDGASDIPGATRGWASADQYTVLVVEGSAGVLLNDFGFSATPGPQDAWTALGAAIAANL